jgi:hypothetical protein
MTTTNRSDGDQVIWECARAVLDTLALVALYLATVYGAAYICAHGVISCEMSPGIEPGDKRPAQSASPFGATRTPFQGLLNRANSTDHDPGAQGHPPTWPIVARSNGQQTEASPL